MIALAIAAIVLTLAVPSFRATIQNNRTTAQANGLASTLAFARSEAIKRSANVTVCSSTDQATCAASLDWSTGWVVRDAAGTVLRIWDDDLSSFTLTGTATSVVYTSTGLITPAAAVTFTLRATGCTGNNGRTISVTATGSQSVAPAACP